jgi:pimeloyl-ACP methyl ester carboxylesterase
MEALAAGEADVQVAGLTVHTRQRGAGEPVVVLHHSTGPVWAPFHDRLAESCAVTAPDLPGFGRSERPAWARSPAHLAAVLGQWLDQSASGPVHLIGFGLGGWVAAELAVMGGARLRSLTLIGAAGLRPREGYIYDPMGESWTSYARRSFRDDEHFAKVFGEDPAQEVVDLWDYSREMTARVTWKPWMWSLPLGQLLKGVQTPALVVWGEADAIVPMDCASQYVEALPQARLEIVPGAGHALELEEPEVLAGLIADFVVSTGSSLSE